MEEDFSIKGKKGLKVKRFKRSFEKGGSAIGEVPDELLENAEPLIEGVNPVLLKESISNAALAASLVKIKAKDVTKTFTTDMVLVEDPSDAP